MSEPVPLADLARLVRSKSAGPFWLTIDVMFDDPAAYARALKSDLVVAEKLALRLRRPAEDLIITALENALAIKVSFPRPHSAGSPRDNDCLGGQQYAGLLDLPIP